MTSLRNILIQFFKANDGFTAKQDIVDYMRLETDFSSEYILRELRKLREDGRLEVEYRGESQHAFYKYSSTQEELFHLKKEKEHETVYEQ